MPSRSSKSDGYLSRHKDEFRRPRHDPRGYTERHADDYRRDRPDRVVVYEYDKAGGEGLGCAGLLFLTIIGAVYLWQRSGSSLSGLLASLGIHIDPRVPSLVLEVVLFLVILFIYGRIRARRFKNRQARLAKIEEPLRLSMLPLDRMTPDEFKQQVAWVVGANVKGVTTQIVGGSDGVDINMYDETRRLAGIVRTWHQPNGYSGPPIEAIGLQTIADTKKRLGVDHAWVVTNGYYSPGAADFGRKNRLRLIDGVHFEKARRKAYARWYARYDDPSRPAPAAPPDFPTSNQPKPGSPPTVPPKPPTNTPNAPLDSVDNQLRERRRKLGLE